MKKYLSVILVAVLAFVGARFVFAQDADAPKMDKMMPAETMDAMANEEMNEVMNEVMNEEKNEAMGMDASAPAEMPAAVAQPEEKKMGY